MTTATGTDRTEHTDPIVSDSTTGNPTPDSTVLHSEAAAAPETVTTETVTSETVTADTPTGETVISETVTSETAADVTAHTAAGEAVIRRNLLWSLAAGVIPVPLLDTVALVGVQVKMLKELSEVYGIPFSANRGKTVVGALLGSVLSTSVGHGMVAQGFLRSVPVVGQVVALATVPAFSAAFTYAVGKVFQQHFASGGTFLTFDPKAVETAFRAKFAEGKRAVRVMAA